MLGLGISPAGVPTVLRAAGGGGGGGGGGDENFASTVLLLGFDGADGATATSDESAVARGAPTFNGNAQLDTAQQKFGTASLLLDGSNDFIEYADSTDWEFGSGAYTVETWVRFPAAAINAAIIGNWGATGGEQAWHLALLFGVLTFRFRIVSTADIDITYAWSPSANTWYHLAVDREASGGKTRLYLNGTMVGSSTNTSALYAGSGGIVIGSWRSSSAYDFNGWVDEVRITKGVARYASDSGFSVPTEAFPRS